MRNITYVLVDVETGLIKSRHSVPASKFEDAPVPDRCCLVLTNGRESYPFGEVRFDMSKLPDPVNVVERYSDVIIDTNPNPKKPGSDLAIAKMDAIARLDELFAKQIAAAIGPMAFIHQEKRRQAEEGGGPLIVDEMDLEAVLINAAKQDEQLAEIEFARRKLKGALRAATSEKEIAAIMTEVNR